MKTAPRRLWIILGVLSFAGILRATLPQVTIGKWTATTALSQARSNNTAVMLSDGSILFSGGDSGSGALQSAEVFGVNGTVSFTTAMNIARSGHFAVALSDGRVLVGGGNTIGGGATNSAEIYDPNANTWAQTSPMTSARANATAALLQDGRVLIAGGDNAGAPNNTIEIYDPSSGNFSFAGTLSSPRTQHAMAVLQDGRVLIVGGFDGNNPVVSSDIFDPASGNISAGPSLATARYAASATTLMNGQVAVIGGAGQGSNGTIDLASIEIFDPTSGVFTDAGVSLGNARQGHQAFLLPNNNSVLVVGGTSAATALGSAELFTAQVSTADGSWSYIVSPIGSMTTARANASGSANQANGPTSTVTPKAGLVILGGGTDASGATLASTEVYGYPTVQTDQGDYPPGSTVNIQGSGFKPGESVSITLVESPLIDTHGPYTVIADGNGNFSDSSFATDIHDVNVRFWLSAVGSQSGAVAQNTFTDALGTNTAISSNNNPSATGQSVTFTATITESGQGGGTSGTPVTVGAVAFYSQAINGNCNNNLGTQIGATQILSPSGTASVVTTFSSAGTFTIRACYTGTGGQGTGNSNAALAQTVTSPVSTTTTISSSLNPSTYGSQVTFTATITPNVGSNGTVDFKDGAATICSGAPVSGSVATCSTSALFATSHSITATYNGAGGFASSTSGVLTQTVTPKALTYTGLTVPASRTYDGTTSAVVSGTASLQSAEALGTGTSTDGKPYTADAVTLTGTATATYNSKDVATAATVTFGGISLTGAGSTNYTLTASTQAATITAKALTYTGLTVPSSRIYDGTTSAVVSGTATLQATETAGTGTASDGKPYNVDSVSLTGTAVATYNSKDVANAATVTFGGISLTGTGNGNYTLTTLTQAATITPKALTYSGLTVPSSRVYDGTTNAVVSGTATLQATESAGTGNASDGKPYNVDSVSPTGVATASYNIKDVAAATTVSFGGISLTGTGNGNYTLTALTQAATITPKALTYTGLTVPASRTYDGTTNAVVSGTATLQGTEAAGAGSAADGKPYTGDSVSLSGTPSATYNSKDVATATTVTFSGILLAGADSTNYTLTAATQAATITPKALTYTGLTVPASKIYDGATSAVVSGTAMLHATEAAGTGTTADGIPYSVDSVNLTGTPTATYNTKDVLTANMVTFGGVSLTGTGNGNYTLTSLTQTAAITPKPLTYSGVSVPASKPYDGTTNAVVSGSATLQTAEAIGTGSSADGKPYTGDTVSVTGAITAMYNSQNVSSANLVTFAGAMLTGSDSGDYTLTALTQAATITPATLTYTANPATRSYGASDPAFSGTVTGFVSAETQATATTGSLAFTTTATAFSNVGNYPINGSGLTANYGNYVFVQAAGNATALSITKAHLAVKADDQSQTYNGMVFSGFTATLSGFVNGETDAGLRGSSALSGAAGFTGAATTAVNAGSYAITPTTGSLTATNYDFTSFVDGTLVINKAHLTVKADDQMKNYDGSAFTAFTVSFTGFVNNENGSVVSGAASFSGNAVGALNAGMYRITPAQGSLTATNYDFTTFQNGSLTINKVHLTIKADDKVKTYDGSAFTAFTATLSGFVNSETDAGLRGSSALSGAAGFTGAATTAVNAGSYAITPTVGSLTATNYDFTSLVDGTLTISKADTSTAVTSSQNPSVFGQAVTFTATITNASATVATPTGTVQFVVDGVNFGAPVVLVAGTATSGPTSALTVSGFPHSVTVSYTNADGNFNNSVGTLAGGQTVNKANTITAITSDNPDPSVVGQPVTVSYSVAVQAPGSGTPTGNVTVSDGIVSCTATVSAGTCMLTFTTAGPKTLTGTYTGDTSFNGSGSAGEPHAVNKADTTTAITSDNPDPSVVGQPVTVSYSVTVQAPGSGMPTGNVTVTDGTVSCTSTVAVGNCMMTFTTAGPKALTATYAGDTNFNGSNSVSEPHTVNKAMTTTTIMSETPSSASVVGQAVNVSYGVTVNLPGSGTPTGTVTVSDGTISCTAAVSAGSCMLTFTSAGARNLTATYAGNSNFLGSVSANAPYFVNKADTTTKINSVNPEPSLVGQSVTINYGVTVNAPGSGTPTGNVTVTDGTVSCTASVAAGSCSLTFNSVGSKTLTATYAGDTNFNMSASAGVPHSVQYKVCLLYDPTRAVKSGATYPLKMYLCDVNSNDISSAAIVVHATSIFMSSTFTGTPEDSGNANPDNDFRFDSTLGPSGGYIFNLQTKGLTGGTYGFSFTAGTDPTTHSVSPGFGVK